MERLGYRQSRGLATSGENPMNIRKFVLVSPFLLLGFMSPAGATVYNIELTGDADVSFQLDTSSPNAHTGSNEFFEDSTPLDVNGSSTVGDVSFAVIDNMGQFEILNIPTSDLTNLAGLVDESGTFRGIYTNGPTTMLEGAELNELAPGSYDLYSYFGPDYNYVLTISEVAAVPEPAGWTMMMAGLGAIGMAKRRRRQTNSSLA
jgi:hypothetical protein